MSDDPLHHPTIQDDLLAYKVRLEILRVKRLEVTARKTRVKDATEQVKFGSMRNIYEKQLAKIDKAIVKAEEAYLKAEALIIQQFGDL
jgi:hypothetical protein